MAQGKAAGTPDAPAGHGPATAGRRRTDPVRRLVESLADGVVLVDGAGDIRYANPAAERLFGRPAAALVGHPFGFPALAGETTEIDVLRPGGRAVTAELRAVDTDWEGAPATLVSLRDVTDRKRAEEHARRLAWERAARAEAEAASQAKSDFLAMMSHELRTPLNAVLGYAELLELGVAGPLTELQREQISRIQMSGRHLLGLVNEVLDLSRVEAGRLTVHNAPGSVSDVLELALAVCHPLAAARGLQLTTAVDSPRTPVFLGDEDRVRQILVNLVSNAVKFTPAGGRIHVACGVADHADEGVRPGAPGPWVYFRVEDTGIGIAPEKLGEIFEPFVQAEAGHTRSRDGSGLGLAISRRLARLMRGDIAVRSTPGEGSTFSLWLPAAETPAGSPRAEPPRPLAVRADVQGLACAGRHLMASLDDVLRRLADRLRAELDAPGVADLPEAQVADHVGSFLADVAHALVALEEAGGQPSPLTADATDIQRLVSERHGAQRARLGWSADAVRQEFSILREVVEEVLAPAFDADETNLRSNAAAVLRGFLDQGEYVSIRAHERTRIA
jgi:signal transduction histidine kinase